MTIRVRITQKYSKNKILADFMIEAPDTCKALWDLTYVELFPEEAAQLFHKIKAITSKEVHNYRKYNNQKDVSIYASNIIYNNHTLLGPYQKLLKAGVLK